MGPEKLYYFQGNSVWADADVGQAVYYMRQLVEDNDYRGRIGEKARSFMDENHSFRQVGERYRRRLQLIGLLPGTEERGRNCLP